MTSLLLGLRTAMGRMSQSRDNKKSTLRRMELSAESLESRNLLTGGSVVQSGIIAYVYPSTTGPNAASVSYQNVSGTTKLDINLNGTDNYFPTGSVLFVYYKGAASSGAQTFQNSTNLHTVAWGGSGANLFISSGTAQDEFFGGSGANTFDAGSGYDEFIGGSGSNTFNESLTGSGIIDEVGATNTVNAPAGATGSYRIL